MSQVVPPALIATGYAGLIAAVAGYWRVDVSAVDRYLVLIGAIWAGIVRWREAINPVVARPLVALPLVVLGTVLYPIGWAGYFVLFKARSLPFWALWLALTLVASGWLLARFGLRSAYRLLFPLLFVAFALPPPESLLQRFQHVLQEVTTTLSEHSLRAIGYPVTRHLGGFLLSLPGGELGVEETCSGVKALTALTALAAFVSFWKRFGVVRGGLLVVAAVPVVVAVNVLRVVLSGVVQEAAGPEYIRDGWHDALGFATVLVGLAVVMMVAKWVAPKPNVVNATDTIEAVEGAGQMVTTLWPHSALLLISLLFTVAVVWHGRTLVPPTVAIPVLDELPTHLGDWTEYQRLPIPVHVREKLEPDAILFREYRNAVGRSATVWVIYWSAADDVRGYHHPDICLPNVGYRETARGVVTLAPSAGGVLPLTSRTLNGTGGELYVLYWTQTGRRVWGPTDESEAMASLLHDRVLGRAVARWTDPTPPEPAGRLVVLIGSPRPTEFGRGEVERFAKEIADEVYKLCPDAAMPVSPADLRP